MKDRSGHESSGKQVDTNTNSLQARVTALEQAMIQKTAKQRSTHGLVWLAIVLLAGFVSLNLWMLNDNLWLQKQHEKEHLFWMICHEGASSEERTHAFVRLVAAGNTEWKSARLCKLKLQGADLNGIDLHQAELDDGDFTRANLTDARLDRSKLHLANLSDADLSGAEMVEADFLKANLSGAKFRDANLRSVSFEQANLQGANLVLADMTEAHLLMADLTQCNLMGANLSGANLEAAVLVRANLSLARLTDTNILDTDFTDSNWWRASGLTGQQILELQQKFPPSKNADPAFQRDFVIWAQK